MSKKYNLEQKCIFDEKADISPVIDEKVMSISHVMETGIVPSSVTEEGEYLDNAVNTTNGILGRIGDPFDALEVDNALRAYVTESKAKYLAKKSADERAKAIADAVAKAQAEVTAQRG